MYSYGTFFQKILYFQKKFSSLTKFHQVPEVQQIPSHKSSGWYLRWWEGLPNPVSHQSPIIGYTKACFTPISIHEMVHYVTNRSMRDFICTRSSSAWIRVNFHFVSEKAHTTQMPSACSVVLWNVPFYILKIGACIGDSFLCIRWQKNLSKSVKL